MKIVAFIAAMLLLPISVYAGTTYTDSVPALHVAITGDNAHAVIDLLTGIQHMLWALLGGMIAQTTVLLALLWRTLK